MLTVLAYIATAFLGLLVLGNVFTYLLQDLFIFQPDRLPLHYSYQFEADWKEINLSGRRKATLNALWFRLPRGRIRRGVVLYFHGNSGNLSRWGNLYHFFFRYGYDFFVFDYRGFGKSRGTRNETLLYDDARLMYEYLRRFYPPEKIVIFGRSIGSAMACRLASEKPARSLILETPFAGMRDLFYTYYPFLPRLFLFKYVFPNRQYLRRVSSPVYIFQGTADFIVPERSAARLKPALKPGDRFIRIETGRHNDLMIYEKYHRQMEEILRYEQEE